MNVDRNFLKIKIIGFVETVSTVVCSKCIKKEEYSGDSYDALDAIVDDGWYATHDNIYCKKCNDKRKSKIPQMPVK